MRTSVNLYQAGTEELLAALRRGGFNSENLTWHGRLYETTKGTIEAFEGEPAQCPDALPDGRNESVGFWTWMGAKDYMQVLHSDSLDAAGEANREALKAML